MRVLALIDVLSFEPAGGAGTVLLQAGRALVRRGHEVHVACRRRNDLPERGEVLGLRFATYAASPRSPWTVWTRGKGATRRAIEEVRPEVVWSHHALPTLWLPPGPAAVPCVYTFHSPWHEEYLTRRGGANGPFALLAASLRRRWERKALARSAAVTVLSQAMGERLTAIHGAPRRMEVIPGGADLERFHPLPDRAEERRRLGLGAGAFLIATVRSLIPRVGIDKLLEAFVQVRERVPHAHLLIGGGGPLRAALEAQAEGLGLRDRVRFLGFVPDDRLAGLLGAADLVVLPSQELEGFGLVAVESLACGTPVVATPVGGLPEVLAPLDKGWLARDKSPAGIAEAIVRQLPLSAEAQQRERCQRYARERFTWDNVALALEALLLQVSTPPREP